MKTGDVAAMDDYGSIRIADRTKDLIKSGGEWISSVDLENAIMSHPAVKEAAVDRHPRPEVGRAAAGLRRPQGGRDRDGGGHPRAPQAAGGQVVAARARRVHRRGAQDQRRQVLEEGPAQPLRRVPREVRRAATRGLVADEGGLAGLAHHGLAGGLPLAHAAGDVHRVEAVLVQPRGHARRAAATAAGHVERVALGEVVEPGRDVAHRDVGRAVDVAVHPLVVLTDVEDDGVGGQFGGGDGRNLLRHHALHRDTTTRTARMERR